METDDNDQTMPTDEEMPADDLAPTVQPNAVDDVALVRDFIVATDSGLIPELVTGASVGEVLASVAAAWVAYERVAEQVRAGQTTVESVARPTRPARATEAAPTEPVVTGAEVAPTATEVPTATVEPTVEPVQVPPTVTEETPMPVETPVPVETPMPVATPETSETPVV